ASTGILKGALLVFVMALADFSNPIIIGGETSFLASDAYLLVTGQQNLEMGAVLGVFLIIPSLIVFIFQTYYVKVTDMTSIGSGSGGGNAPLNKGLRGITFGICTLMSFFIITMFVLIVFIVFVKFIVINYLFCIAI